MRIDKYEVNICSPSQKPFKEHTIDKIGGYIGLTDQEQYCIELINHDPNRKALATITIDGNSIGGSLILGAGKRLSLEGPPVIGNDSKRFTFFEQNSVGFEKAGLDQVAESKLGLVEVSFEREKRDENVVYRSSYRGSSESFYGRGGNPGPTSRGGGPKSSEEIDISELTRGSSFTPGGTGLSGVSTQRFTTANFDKDVAFSPISIKLRLANDPERQMAFSGLVNELAIAIASNLVVRTSNTNMSPNHLAPKITNHIMGHEFKNDLVSDLSTHQLDKKGTGSDHYVQNLSIQMVSLMLKPSSLDNGSYLAKMGKLATQIACDVMPLREFVEQQRSKGNTTPPPLEKKMGM
jgi:hypothetical protein